MCREESMNLLTTDLEIEGYQYPFLIDPGATVIVIKLGIGKGQRVDPIEFTVKGVIGTEIQTSGSRIVEFRQGRRFYRHKFIVASVQMEYSQVF
jgi:hypothetical protein